MVDSNRRGFPRLKAQVFARPAGLRERRNDDGNKVVNISLTGIRMYTDERCAVGDHLKLEVILPDRTSVTIVAKVVWIDALGAGEPAKFDLGAEFTRIDSKDALRLKDLLQD